MPGCLFFSHCHAWPAAAGCFSIHPCGMKIQNFCGDEIQNLPIFSPGNGTEYQSFAARIHTDQLFLRAHRLRAQIPVQPQCHAGSRRECSPEAASRPGKFFFKHPFHSRVTKPPAPGRKHLLVEPEIPGSPRGRPGWPCEPGDKRVCRRGVLKPEETGPSPAITISIDLPAEQQFPQGLRDFTWSQQSTVMYPARPRARSARLFSIKNADRVARGRRRYNAAGRTAATIHAPGTGHPVGG